MLDSLPKLADRAFILGFFLPAGLFLMVVALLLGGPVAGAALVSDLSLSEPTDAALLLVGAWVLGVLLMVLNHPLYRALEGYIGPLSMLRRAQKKSRSALSRKLEELEDLGERYEALRETFPPDSLARYQALLLELASAWPTQIEDVLPTRFGNAIKSFEVYPRDVYGADGPAIWLRLISVVPKAVQDQVTDSRSQIDFLINACLLSSVVAGLALLKLALALPWLGAADPFIARSAATPVARAVGIAVLGLVASRAFYLWATSRVPAWGELVKTVFDCYLPALARQIGHQPPATDEARTRFWRSYSQTVIYGRERSGGLPFVPEQWPAAPPPAAPADAADGEAETG